MADTYNARRNSQAIAKRGAANFDPTQALPNNPFYIGPVGTPPPTYVKDSLGRVGRSPAYPDPQSVPLEAVVRPMPTYYPRQDQDQFSLEPFNYAQPSPAQPAENRGSSTIKWIETLGYPALDKLAASRIAARDQNQQPAQGSQQSAVANWEASINAQASQQMPRITTAGAGSQPGVQSQPASSPYAGPNLPGYMHRRAKPVSQKPPSIGDIFSQQYDRWASGSQPGAGTTKRRGMF